MKRGKKNGGTGDNDIGFVPNPQRMALKRRHAGSMRTLVAAAMALSPGKGAVRAHTKTRGNVSVIASVMSAALGRTFSTFVGADGYAYIYERDNDN